VGAGVRLQVTLAQVAAGEAGMRVRARRRLDMVLLAIAGLLVGGVAAASAAIWDSERVSGLWAGAELAGDGSASIVEVIDYDFGILRRHGIFRDVPALPRRRGAGLVGHRSRRRPGRRV
jgi:hypothetical protein